MSKRAKVHISKNPRRFRPVYLGLAVVFFLLSVMNSFALEITLPNMEMAAWGRTKNERFTVSSMVSADLALTEGEKYSFLLGFTLEARDIGRAFAHRNYQIGFVEPGNPVTAAEYNALADRLNNQAFIGFRIAQATVKDLFNSPLEFSFFIGQGDIFGNGDEFPSRFGISPIGTDFRGFFYFPEGIGGNPLRRYNGIYGIQGTGISLTLTRWDNIIPMAYFYQNFSASTYVSEGINDRIGPNEYGDNLYSSDLRLLYNHRLFRIDTFMGFSAYRGQEGRLRGGIMAHFGSDGMEFFIQGGIPGFTLGQEILIDHVYFLMEPRLSFGNFGINVTFFYHPVEYMNVISEEERGKADLNFKFWFGGGESGLTGGFEAGAILDLNTDTSDYNFNIGPFISFDSGFLRWDLKCRVNLSDMDTPNEMIEIFFGVRTVR